MNHLKPHKTVSAHENPRTHEEPRHELHKALSVSSGDDGAHAQPSFQRGDATPLENTRVCQLLFLGDFVDRGANGLEVMCLLLALVIATEGSVFLVRGNHENGVLNKVNGFFDECKVRVRLLPF